MENEDYNAFEPALSALGAMAAQDRMSFSLTLAVDGMLVSGTAVSFNTFLGGLEDGFAELGTHLSVLLSQGIGTLKTQLDPQSPPPDVLYLRDVTIWAPGGVRSISWWACRLSAVSGWWIE